MNLFLFLSTIVMGTTLLNYYSTYIFLGTNGTNGQAEPTSFYSQVRLFNVCMGVIKLGTTLLGSYFSDKLGRKFLYLLGYMGWSAGMLAFAVFGYENLGLEQRLVMLFLQALSGMTISTVLYTYMADTLPAKGMSFVLAIDSLVMFVYVTLFPTLMSTPKKMDLGFLVFAFIGFGSLPIVWIFVKETKNKSLDEVYRMFNPKLQDEEREGLVTKEKVANNDLVPEKTE